MSSRHGPHDDARTQRWVLAGAVLLLAALVLWWLRRTGGSRKIIASLERLMSRMRGA